MAKKTPEEPAPKADDNNTDQLKAEFFPEASISVIIKHKGKIYSHGALYVEELAPNDGLYRAMARAKGLMNEILLTFYGHKDFGNRPDTENMQRWYSVERKKRIAIDKSSAKDNLYHRPQS